MGLWQYRVVDEKRELDEKIAKLRVFMSSENPVFRALPMIDCRLFTQQYAAMVRYSTILQERIARFGKN